MDLFRSGLKGFSIGGFKLDENTANLVANFASGGGLSNAFDQISRTISPNPRKAPPRPPPIGSFKVVNSKRYFFLIILFVIMSHLTDKKYMVGVISKEPDIA